MRRTSVRACAALFFVCIPLKMFHEAIRKIRLSVPISKSMSENSSQPPVLV